MAELKTVKNSWMENETLVSAAVEAVRQGRPLSWNRIYTHGGTTWSDYNRAAAWVSRERKKREWGFDVSRLRPFSEATLKTASKAAIALRAADLGKDSEEPEIQPEIQKQDVIHLDAEPVNTKPPENSAVRWLKGAAFQFVGLLILLPLGLLFGFRYGGGLIAGIILPVAFVLGILILIFRFVRRAVSSVKKVD